MTIEASLQADVDPDLISIEDDSFINLTDIPDELQPVAHLLLQGYTINEAAAMLGMKSNALRQRLWRYRVTKHPAQFINS